MDAFAAPLETLTAAMSEFIATPTVRLLLVRTDAELRAPAIEVVMAHEFRPENPAAFYLFEQPHTATSPGWEARTEHATAQLEHRTAEDSTLPEAVGGAAGFARQLISVAQAAPGGSSGVVGVLAPSLVEDGASWVAALEPMITNPSGHAARFILIETAPAQSTALAEKFDGDGRTVDVLVDAGQRESDMTSLLDAAIAGRAIGASPSATAPPHPAAAPQHPPTPEGKLRGLVSAALLGASKHLQAGEGPAAVGEVRKARDLVASAGAVGEAINLELLLGGVLVGAGGLAAAAASFGRAIVAAKEANRQNQAAMGHFALGATKLSARDRHGALVTYAEGTVAAEKSEQPALAIEGARMTGSLAEELGLEAQAITFWTKAVKLAEDLGPQAPLTSAAESARRLAQMCRRRGLTEQAAVFEDKASTFESIVVPEAPTAIEEGPPDAGAQLEDVAADEVAKPPLAASAPAAVAGPLPAFAQSAPQSEGTGMLSVDDIARLHSDAARAAADEPLELDAKGSGQNATEDELPEELGMLDEAQLEILRVATFEILDEDSTGLLTADELAMIRGEKVMFIPRPTAERPPTPPPMPPPAPAELDLGFDLGKIAALRDVQIDDEFEGGSKLRRRGGDDPPDDESS